jgi:ATP-binding cassette subfamily F protein 3
MRAPMIAFRNFALRRGQRLLLSEVDLALHAGWRVGVVGRNGTGKSSLFAALMRELESDAGDLDLPGKVRIASVAQETPSLPDAAIDFVLQGDAEVARAIALEAHAMAREDWEAVAEAHIRLEELNGYDATARAGRLLHGLGFPAETHHKAVSDFSGGWRVRLNVARALMTPSDLLLLDEPTNHLDLDAVLWLEQWLLKYPGTLLLISHDREFLDEVCTHTLHLHEQAPEALHRRLHQLRTPARRATAPAADRAREGTGRARPPAEVHRPLQGQGEQGQAGAVAGEAPGQAGRHRSGARRARDPHQFAEPPKLPNSLIRLNHVDAGYARRTTRTKPSRRMPSAATSRFWAKSASASKPAIASACSGRTARASRPW